VHGGNQEKRGEARSADAYGKPKKNPPKKYHQEADITESSFSLKPLGDGERRRKGNLEKFFQFPASKEGGREEPFG